MARNTGLFESRAQRYRAVAIYNNGKESLLRLGSSFGEVQETYDEPYNELLDDEERSQVKEIQLQKWSGSSDCGHWVMVRNLDIPRPSVLNIIVKSQV